MQPTFLLQEEAGITVHSSAEGVGEVVNEVETRAEEADNVHGGDVTSSLGNSESTVNEVGSLGNEVASLAEGFGGCAHHAALERELGGALLQADERRVGFVCGTGHQASSLDHCAWGGARARVELDGSGLQASPVAGLLLAVHDAIENSLTTLGDFDHVSDDGHLFEIFHDHLFCHRLGVLNDFSDVICHISKIFDDTDNALGDHIANLQTLFDDKVEGLNAEVDGGTDHDD